MSSVSINRVIVTGNLTDDPELRSLPSGTSVCKLRIAVNTSRKNNASGEWESKPNYFDVIVWGQQGANANQYLAKGRPVAIDGRLEWREWETKEGNKRQAVEIVAEKVQFLGSPNHQAPDQVDTAAADTAASDAAPPPTDDDIPF
jgi:single-strand DNA-binding protein